MREEDFRDAISSLRRKFESKDSERFLKKVPRNIIDFFRRRFDRKDWKRLTEEIYRDPIDFLERTVGKRCNVIETGYDVGLGVLLLVFGRNADLEDWWANRSRILTYRYGAGSREEIPTIEQGTQDSWSIPGKVGGLDVSACGDTGSEFDIVSTSFAERNSIGITRDTKTREYTLPDGQFGRFVGSVLLPFQFRGEQETYMREFQVLQGCVQDVILSRSFLSVTGTLNRFRHRIVRTIFGKNGFNKLLSIGSAGRSLPGFLDGIPAKALADTGSDLNLVSETYAKSNGFAVDRHFASRRLVQFANGTRKKTHGVIRGVAWSFGDQGETPIQCDFHVLEGQRYEVVLGAGFLYNNDIFSLHSAWTQDLASCESENLGLSYVRVLGPTGKILRKFLRKLCQRKGENRKTLIWNYGTNAADGHAGMSENDSEASERELELLNGSYREPPEGQAEPQGYSQSAVDLGRTNQRVRNSRRESFVLGGRQNDDRIGSATQCATTV